MNLITQQLRRILAEDIDSGDDTIRSISRQTGVEPATLSRWLRGQRAVTSTTIDALAYHYQCRLVRTRKSHENYLLPE